VTIDEAANLAEAFADACTHHAGEVALVYRGQKLTYADLHDRVRTVAGNLAQRASRPGGGAPGAAVPGGGPGAKVPIIAVVIEPSPAPICAVLGAVVAGMTYLPLDPAAPDEYLNQILADAGPMLVVTSPGRAARLKCDGGEIVTFGELHIPAGRPAGSDGATAPCGTDPAYVIYTSGSTGTPKGVVVGHRALLNSTAARLLAYGVPRRIPLVHSIAFDLASGVVFWALLTGGTLIISADKLTDVAATLDLIREHDITHLVYPASLYAPFLDRASLAPPTGLKHVMIGSERWPSVLIGRHAGLLPGTSLHNEYGPTEACVWSSYACVYDGETRRQAPMTLGTPILNTGYLVLDERGAPVTAGGRGELNITGANLATGYLHNPDLTAQRFIFLPDGTRAYRTGDLVEVTGDGGYVFAGRADRQIKVQGNRIEAGHVETLLMSHELVQQSHVMARNDSGMGSALVAYLVPRGRPGHPDGWPPAGLGAYLAERLPAYMVPSAYVVLGDLPRTLNGKIDEARLPAPASTAADAVPPADVLEARLAALIGGILGAGEIGVETALGTLGANSLAFVRISAAITRDHGADIPLSALFTSQTVRAIARQVRSSPRSDRPALARQADAPLTAPLSAQQHQIWILHNFAPDSFAYTTQFSVRLTGAVDVPRLEDALSRIV
jgi:amino acid adenylation domain-containing protein